MVIFYLGFACSIPIFRFWHHFFVSLPLAIKDAWFHFCILHPPPLKKHPLANIAPYTRLSPTTIVSYCIHTLICDWKTRGPGGATISGLWVASKATIPRSASAMANQFSGAVDQSKEFCHLTWMFYYPTSWCIRSFFRLC